MVRMGLACFTLSLAALTAGCQMCANTYDECGPTFTGECGESCCPHAPRAGSILAAGGESTPVPQIDYRMQGAETLPVAEPAPAAAAAPEASPIETPKAPAAAGAKTPAETPGWSPQRPTVAPPPAVQEPVR